MGRSNGISLRAGHKTAKLASLHGQGDGRVSEKDLGASEQYAEIPVLPKQPQHGSTTKFLFCALGVLLSFFVFGIFQERITRGVYGQERFHYVLSLVFVQCAINAIFAQTMIRITREPRDTTPRSWYGVCSLSYLAAMLFSHQALQHVSYPTQVLGKSFPVMVFGVLFAHHHYPLKNYLFVLSIVVGVGIFFYESGKQTSMGERKEMGFGKLLLVLSLLMDGVTGAVQDRMLSAHKTRPNSMMMWMNAFAALVLLSAIVFTGELVDVVHFATRHPIVIEQLLTFATCGAVGQYFIYLMVTEFGSSPCSIVTTTRKFFTILASVIFFNNAISPWQWVSAFMVFTGLVLDVKYGKDRIQQKQEDATACHTDERELKTRRTNPYQPLIGEILIMFSSHVKPSSPLLMSMGGFLKKLVLMMMVLLSVLSGASASGFGKGADVLLTTLSDMYLAPVIGGPVFCHEVTGREFVSCERESSLFTFQRPGVATVQIPTEENGVIITRLHRVTVKDLTFGSSVSLSVQGCNRAHWDVGNVFRVQATYKDESGEPYAGVSSRLDYNTTRVQDIVNLERCSREMNCSFLVRCEKAGQTILQVSDATHPSLSDTLVITVKSPSGPDQPTGTNGRSSGEGAMDPEDEPKKCPPPSKSQIPMEDDPPRVRNPTQAPDGILGVWFIASVVFAVVFVCWITWLFTPVHNVQGHPVYPGFAAKHVQNVNAGDQQDLPLPEPLSEPGGHQDHSPPQNEP